MSCRWRWTFPDCAHTTCSVARPFPYCARREIFTMADVFIAFDQDQIRQCEKLIRPYVRRTPILAIDGADLSINSLKLSLKLELFQHSGSFKARGAFANLLLRKVPAADVVAASGGNHGAAVAYAAMTLKIPARIFVPSVSSPAKIARIREYGADLVIEGDRYADALAASEAWVERSGAMPVHAFDQYETMLGQATIALELSDQVPDIDTLLVSVGGGGLIAGIAAWYGGAIKVIGVEPFAAPTLTKALAARRPVDAEAGGLAADSLAPQRIGEKVFPITKSYVHGTVLVTDDAIRLAQKMLAHAASCRGAGGSSGMAYKPQGGERVAVIISGGNTTA